jgi:AcrR family transcriptional regulator
LLEQAYAHVCAHGLTGMSLRPLATAIGSSPRVLLFLFGSKEGLVRELLARARADQLALLSDLAAGAAGPAPTELPERVAQVWAWLADASRRPLLGLWAECYVQSLGRRDGPWAGFAATTVQDWLDLLARAQPEPERGTAGGLAARTLALAVLRGALLDLLATGDAERAGAAVRRYLDLIDLHPQPKENPNR